MKQLTAISAHRHKACNSQVICTVHSRTDKTKPCKYSPLSLLPQYLHCRGETREFPQFRWLPAHREPFFFQVFEKKWRFSRSENILFALFN